MSGRVTRKRSRAEEEVQDLPPTKREVLQEDLQCVDGSAGSGNTQLGADGHAKDGQILQQDGEFWFEDGTVILVARGIEFRVYKGVLSGLSSVFKDLFAEQHVLRTVRMDGVSNFPCSVVHVADSPEDLRHLLRACFSKRLGRLYGERHPSYHEISAAIRLGDKYRITELYSQSLEYLKHYFPSTLKGWNTLSKDINLDPPPGWKEFEELGVINLARLTGELSLLPSAFVSCICSDSTKPERWGIGHGFTLEDGSQERLSPGDLTVCLNGKTNLRIATITAILRTFHPAVSSKCQTASACKKAFRDLLLNLEENVVYLVRGNPFAEHETFVEGKGLGVYASCTTMVRERSLKERQSIWDRLPELLGIEVPGWKEAPPSSPQTSAGAT